MNTGIQYKLYNYEVIPPEGIWQKIAGELDDSALGQKFPASLYELTVPPPPAAWRKIAAALEEAVPVEGISAKLFEAEAIPPVSAWNKISTALDADKENATEKRRILPFARYAAAAVVIGLMTFAALKLFKTEKTNNDTANKNIPVNTPLIPVTPEESIIPENTIDLNNPDAEEARNDAALEASKKIYASLDVSKKKRQNIASGFHFSSFTGTENSGDIINTAYTEIETAANSITDRYIVLMTPEGNFIRMSKKLSNLVCCVSGEEQDKDCKDQVEKWRKQLACSTAAHPGNFMDILSLVSSLQED